MPTFGVIPRVLCSLQGTTGLSSVASRRLRGQNQPECTQSAQRTPTTNQSTGGQAQAGSTHHRHVSNNCQHVKAKTPSDEGVFQCPRWDSKAIPGLVNAGKSGRHAESGPDRWQFGAIRSEQCAQCAHLFLPVNEPDPAPSRRLGQTPLCHAARQTRPVNWKPQSTLGQKQLIAGSPFRTPCRFRNQAP
jgi:hypothetical protein